MSDSVLKDMKGTAKSIVVVDAALVLPRVRLEKQGRENTASYQKLLRKLAPSVTNSATTYLNLLHLLQACRICGGRVTFCETCEKSATEYFTKFSIAELEKSYGRQLPPPDAHAVMEFEKELKLREQAIKEKL
ncbi:unnamed protein product [Aphanomyces euteiches]